MVLKAPGSMVQRFGQPGQTLETVTLGQTGVA